MPVFHREKAIELAARLLWLAGTSISAFRLLLLLYLAERAFLLRYAERFTGSSAEALPDGPMLTDVAALFSGEASPAADGFARGPHGLRLATTCKPSFDHLSAADIETADSIWAQFGKLSEAELKVLLQNGLCPEW
ncbi:type II toxin-antitoxin system antitoxin SocA domain-containing protein [Duodenibacillus massiliensis]|uniref:type II toxin-antitoxin system antitoxin SocA domain-containing protein n=1 Tax=Duodenibacillus massiliensis TaxID=1852381 RepID=UPI00307B38B0